jgi:hypothetical protein
VPEGQCAWARAIVVRAYKQTEVATARRLLHLARRLEDGYTNAAASVREALEDGLSDRLRQSIATNAARA